MSTVTLYRPGSESSGEHDSGDAGEASGVVSVEEIADWVDERVEDEVRVRDRFVTVHRSDDLPEAFAGARVLSPYDRETGNTMLGTVRYEERALEDPDRVGGVLYDGVELQRVLNGVLPEAECGPDHLHVAILDRAIGTWGEHDGRWHKRVNVLGQPALVSVPGLYEGPAKPEQYYKEKQKHALLSGDAPPREVLENDIEGEFLIENDPRTTAALKGYVLQAVHFWNTGEAFCDDASCRLSNPHRQPGVIEAQLREPEFCEEHAARYQ
ncbi:MAG: DUF6775 family putative metallopeptidase [Halodesulfurarchaeum sp.]